MKLKLDIDDLTGSFFEDTRLLGIVAPVKDYQLCWQLNNRLRFKFRINHEIEIQLTRKQRKYYFGIYECPEPNSALVHYLYNNQFSGEYLLPEFRHFDFLWLLKGDAVESDYIQNLAGSIKSINGIQLVTELTVTMIKNKGHLVF